MNTRHALATLASLSLWLGIVGCSSDETTAAGADAAGPGASSGAGTGAGGAGGHDGTGASGAASSAASSSSVASSSSGQGGAGGAGGCAGKACGSGCMTEAGSGICDPGGSCVVTPVQCPGYAPCDGAKCGTACSSCDPSDPTCEPASGTVCDITSVCIFPPPACD